MKIGIDAMPLQDQLTGVGNYLLRLLQELILLRPIDTFYLYTTHTNNLLNKLAESQNVRLRTHNFLGISEALWSQTTLAFMCYRDQLDLFWGTTQSLPLLSRFRQKNILTVHDFAYLLYPQTVSSVRGFYLRALGKYFYKKADRILANSHGTATRLKELYNREADQVIIPPVMSKTVNDESVWKRFQLENKKYYLMVSTLEPRKNLIAALHAFQQIKPLDPLVLVGKQGWKNSQIKEEIIKSKHIKFVGYLNEKDLTTLMSGAKAYIMPSLYEGYGMPIAEARCLGTPVICTNSPEMVEAAEGDAFFLDPNHLERDLHKALNGHLPAPKKCEYPSAKELASLLSDEIDKK